MLPSLFLLALSPSAAFQAPDRILSCYILYSMYAPHPISINPFATVLHAIFVRETNKALETEKGGGLAENDQFVYVLWKILKGDGKDVGSVIPPIPPNPLNACGSQIGPFSPQHILKHPIPPELRAVVLVKDANTRSWQFNLYGLLSIRSTLCSWYAQYRAGEDFTTEDGSIVNLASGLGVSSVEITSRQKITPDEDREMAEVSRGTSLLLAARERVLSLSEQRVCLPAALPRVGCVDPKELTGPPFLRFSSLY